MCRDNLPVWQKRFEKYGSEDFTVVGLALDAEGIAPAKRYYDRFNVTFPSLVDPNYATQFGVVPKTIFIDEHGVVRSASNWERQLAKLGDVRPVPKTAREQWSAAESRFDAGAIARLAAANTAAPADLRIATQLASRYFALKLRTEAKAVLARAIQPYDAKAIARKGGAQSRLLGQAYFQMMRCHEGDRRRQTEYATISYYLNPTIGFAKQIARVIDPTKFDNRRDGSLDDTFRQATYERLKRERKQWLAK